MGVNKVIYGGETVIDLTSDTVTADKMLEDIKAHGANGEKVTGTMPNKGAVNAVISYKSEQYTIPEGYHDGSGKVGISATEKAKIIPANIKSGISILGVTGTLSSSSGGLPSGISAVASGTFTPTSDITSNYSVSHNLGTTPNFYCVYDEADIVDGEAPYGMISLDAFVKNRTISSGTIYPCVFVMNYKSSTGGSVAATTYGTTVSTYFTSTQIKLYASGARQYLAGHTYRWFAMVLA